KPEPIGANLSLGTFYAGEVTLTKNENAYEAYFNIADALIAVGDVYDVSLTVGENASAFKQVAIQSDCDGWAWDGHSEWVNSAMPGTKLSTSFEVTKELSGTFQIKIYMDNASEEMGDTVKVGINGLKITKQNLEVSTPTPEPSDSEPFTDGMTIELDKEYSGEVSAVSEAYKALATFYLEDADVKKGDVYTVTYTVSGAKYNQIGFQTDADVVIADNNYPWHNKYYDEKIAIPDGTVETYKIEVTADGVSKYTNGKVSCKLTAANVVGSVEPSDKVRIENFKITVERKVVVEGARYEVTKVNKPATEALDFASGEGWENYQKPFAFPEGLNVDEVIVVWKSTISFNGIIGMNIDGKWNGEAAFSSSSGSSTWKLIGLTEKNLDDSPTANIQIWYPSTGLTAIT
ncbi:MAG: hypothetical protein K2O03_12545, partial [Lachnospiraceae bacterium]|nr:hypothetical protein [Lachnospiraceae bacterium]